MESIYHVLCWHFHRRCRHCYDERFRPYVRDELESVVSEAVNSAPAIINNLPASMQYLDRNTPEPDSPGGYRQRTGRIIISGGVATTDHYPVRYRAMDGRGKSHGPTVSQVVAEWHPANRPWAVECGWQKPAGDHPGITAGESAVAGCSRIRRTLAFSGQSAGRLDHTALAIGGAGVIDTIAQYVIAGSGDDSAGCGAGGCCA